MIAPLLTIEPAPEWGADVKRFTVTCASTTTCLLHTPGERLKHATDARIVTCLLVRHARLCGRCDLGPLWGHADLALLDAAERIAASLGAFELSERRN